MDDETETPPPSRMKAMLPLVGMLIVGLGAGFGGSLAFGGKGEAAEPEEAAAAEEGEAAEPAEGQGEAPAPKEGGHGEVAAEPAASGASHGAGGGSSITSLGRFTVNLRGSGGGRILQMEVALEAGPEAGDRLETLTPRLRDSINTAVSDYTWTELEGTDGKTRLKDELLSRINGVTDPVVVNAVYLTSFVVS
jgi:flagellar basal body-associated protein FliL